MHRAFQVVKIQQQIDKKNCPIEYKNPPSPNHQAYIFRFFMTPSPHLGKVDLPRSLGLTPTLPLPGLFSSVRRSLLRRRMAPIRRWDGDRGFLGSLPLDLRLTWFNFLAACRESVLRVPLASAAMYLNNERKH